MTGAAAVGWCASASAFRVRDQPGQTLEVLQPSISFSATDPIVSPIFLRDAPFNGPNHMSESRWLYRATGTNGADAREYGYANASVPGGPTSSGFFVGDLSGNLDAGGMDFFVTNSTSGYSFASQQRWILQPGQIGSFTGLVLTMRNTVQNTGAGAMTIHSYNYANIDPGGSTNHAFSGFSHPETVGAEALLRNIDMTYGAAPPTRDGVAFWYQVAGDGSVRDALFDNSPTILNDTVSGSPGDLEAASHWMATLAPGESMEFEAFVFFGLVPSPGSSLLLGAGLLAMAGRRRGGWGR